MMEDIWIYVLSFFIYSFIGWIWESICIHAIWLRKFVNRGFLYGPMLPIYGSGALIVIFLFRWLDGFPLIVMFFIGGFVACVVEFLTSWVMEVLFHERWWDYSKKPLNIQGRVCLEGFVCFGLFGVVASQYIQPYFYQKLSMIPLRIMSVLSVIFIIAFVVDMMKSVHIALNIKKEIDEIVRVLEEEQLKLHLLMMDTQKELEALGNIKTLRQLINRIDQELKNKHYRYGQRRILKAFPYIVKRRIKDVHEKIHRD